VLSSRPKLKALLKGHARRFVVAVTGALVFAIGRATHVGPVSVVGIVIFAVGMIFGPAGYFGEG
jgi:hypothetical protein